MRKRFLTYIFALACLTVNAQEEVSNLQPISFEANVVEDSVVAAPEQTEVVYEAVTEEVSDTARPKVKPTFAEYNTTKNGWGYGVRMGACVGGTSPFPIPEEIREIVSFGVNGSFMQEFYGYKLFNERVGIYVGERIACEGMKTTARVKNYHMSIVQDGEEMAGYYTGIDETNTKTVSVKIPVEAMFRITPRFDLRVGPYMQFNIKKSFEGSVYDGYLRVGDPTGQKVDFAGDACAVYDFSSDMKTFLVGAELAADYKITKHFGWFAHLDWGVNSVFPDDFETITFNMFPIYFSLGLFVGL